MKLAKNWRSKLNYQSKLIDIKNIEERNNVFKSLKKNEQRMEIALDVIGLINSKYLSGSDRTYWSEKLTEINENSKNSKKFQKSMLNIKSCQVCARGAMMLSTIRVGNKIEPGYLNNCDGDDTNQKYFTSTQYEDMEDVYEGYYMEKNRPYKNRTTKMLANIFLQVIQNDGNFTSKDFKNYLKDILK